MMIRADAVSLIGSPQASDYSAFSTAIRKAACIASAAQAVNATANTSCSPSQPRAHAGKRDVAFDLQHARAGEMIVQRALLRWYCRQRMAQVQRQP